MAESMNRCLFICTFSTNAQEVVHLNTCRKDAQHAFGVDGLGASGQIFELDSG